MGLDFLVPIFGILIVLVPVLGVTTILTLNYGLKPFIEALAKEMRGLERPSQLRLEAQVDDLGEQLAQVTTELRRLREAQDFDRQLIAGAEPTES